MRQLKSVRAISDYALQCVFENGTQKIASSKPFLNAEAFKPLSVISIFNQVENKGFYVSWLNEEIDLSADTLWSIGVENGNV